MFMFHLFTSCCQVQGNIPTGYHWSYVLDSFCNKINNKMMSYQCLSVFLLSFHSFLNSFPFFVSRHQDNKRMKRTLEEEQRARKELERIVRRVLKNMNDPTWDETNL